MLAWLAVVFSGLVGVAAAVDEEEIEEVIVYEDPFLRWDDTRWLVQTEQKLPFPLPFQSRAGQRFDAHMFQVNAILHCNKTHVLTARRQEVDCLMEDVAIVHLLPVGSDDFRAAVRQTESKRSLRAHTRLDNQNAVLSELDARLSGARIQLQVAANGRVTNTQIEGIETVGGRAGSLADEAARQLVQRLVVGFDLKLRKGNRLNEGKWVEFGSDLYTMPVPLDFGASVGSSTVVHYLNKYKGRVLVQSIGEGLLSATKRDGPGDEVFDSHFDGRLHGVSLFDPQGGYMTDRVWSVLMVSSPGSLVQGSFYHHGKIRQLSEHERPDVGVTGLATDVLTDGFAQWVTLDADL